MVASVLAAVTLVVMIGVWYLAALLALGLGDHPNPQEEWPFWATDTGTRVYLLLAALAVASLVAAWIGTAVRHRASVRVALAVQVLILVVLPLGLARPG
jgi:hypothetical protein